ncbi:MAG: hypothetical protein EXS31_16150 [Pedosphaera sp.]|nr:hypothetical protein [Pedosphaera sp.]
MSFETLKHELSVLSPPEQRRLLAYLVSLQDASDVTYRESLARKIDDRDPSHFATLEELDRKLGLTPDDQH